MPDFDDYKIVTLGTPPLTLEPLTAAHAEELFTELSNPALYEFLPQNPPVSLEALRQRYRRWEKRRSPAGDELWLNWVVRLNTHAAGLLQATISQAKKSYIAYEVFEPFQQQGVATAAVPLMLDHLRRAPGVNTAAARVDTRNQRSIRLLERLGFTRVRLIKDADNFKGAASDEYEYERNLLL